MENITIEKYEVAITSAGLTENEIEILETNP